MYNSQAQRWKGVSAKLLVWFFAAVKMQIISKIFFPILGVKITLFVSLNWSFRGTNWIKSARIGDFDPKMVGNIFEIICIFTAAKNHTNNFADTPFGPDYCTSSKVIPHWVKKSLFFQCIFVKKSNLSKFFIRFIQNYICNSCLGDQHI